MADHTGEKIARFGRITFGVSAGLVVLWAFAWVGTRSLRRPDQKTTGTQLTIVHWGDDREDAIVAGLIGAPFFCFAAD